MLVNRIGWMGLLAAAVLAWSGSVRAIDFTVNDPGDAPDDDAPMDDALCETAGGVCTLRAAIEEANENTGPHKITFATSVMAVALTNDLPDVRAEIEFDGTNPMAVGGRVDINGDDGVGGRADCFDFISTGTDTMTIQNPNGGQGSTLKNFVVRNCSGDGVSLDGHGYLIQGNLIGTTPAGTAAAGNAGHGIILSGSAPPPNSLPGNVGDLISQLPTDYAGITAFVALFQTILNTIVEPNVITLNTISGNSNDGIHLFTDMTVNTNINLNIIGLSSDSTTAIPNGADGSGSGITLITGAWGNLIGPGNIISGNGDDGILMTPDEVFLPNFILGNLIGPGATPLSEVGNNESGIRVDARPDLDGMGLDNPTNLSLVIGPANTISDNKGNPGAVGFDVNNDDDAGIAITDDSSRVRVFANVIGLFAFPPGSSPIGSLLEVGNEGNGILITSPGHQIGDGTLLGANLIMNNGRHGIQIRSSAANDISIAGNFIGVAQPTGLDVFDFGNAGDGIHINAGGSVKIGGAGSLEPNIIGGNGRHGIAMRNASATQGWANLMQRNQIYANDRDPAAPVGLGIDLDDVTNGVDDADNSAVADPQTNTANFGQNQPIACTGPGMPVAGCTTGASFNAGNSVVQWRFESAPSRTYRIEFFSRRADGMTFLNEQMVTTDATGLASGGGCVAGLCSSSVVPMSPTDTRGTSIVMTATDVSNAADVPGAVMMAPHNNTSEFSNPAAIPQEIVFSAVAYSSSEGVMNATVTLQRLGVPTGAVGVDVVLAGAPGTATGGGVDYALGANPVTWADGDSASKTFTITVTGDTLDEADETVNLELANPTGAIEGTPNAATFTILDDDLPPTIAIADNSVVEGESTVQLGFTATLSAPSSFDVVVSYNTANGSAIAPADYLAAVNQQVTILAGATQANFNIDVVGDVLDEANETFVVNITATNTTAAGSDLQATGTITDNDAPPAVSINDVGPLPEGNAATTPFPFTVSLSAVSGQNVDVTAISGNVADTATAPADYGAVNQVVTIPAGMLSAPLTVDVVGDTVFEPGATEVFTVTLSAPVNATLGDAVGQGTITNDDLSPGTLQFTPAAPDQSVAESVGTATFTVSRTGGTAGAVSTTVTLGGDAVVGAGNDYTTTPLTLNWADGDAANQTITITVNDDVAQESAETVTLTLGAPTGGATLGVPAMATLTIQANDAPAGALQFTPAAPDQSVAENVGTATFTVSRTGGTAGAVSTTVMLGGDAVVGAGNDYTTTPLTLNWADGDATNQTITITVNDDATPEAAETVTLTLGAPTGGATLGAPAMATLTIQASDASAGTLQFTPVAPDQSVAENVGIATFTVSRAGGSAGAVSTTIALGGDAVIGAGNDYTTSALTLNWADGDAANKTVTITVNDDAAPEAAETVTLTLGAPTGGATLGAPAVATLTIQASDAAAGSLQFTPVAPDQSVAENVGIATFTVSRSGGSAGAVSTTVTLGGDATIGAGNDYTTSALTLNWADGDVANKTITVTVNDDAAPEAAETVTLTLGAPTGGATLGAPAMATLTIQASDAAAGSLQFTPVAPDQSVAENVGTATFTVSRTGGSAGAVSTTVTLGGSATIGAGNDYTTSALTLNWADGDVANKTITVTVNDDAAPEAAETVTLTLGAPTGGATLGAPAMATLTIQASDAAAGSLQFTPVAPDQSVAENVGTATFTVSRTGGSAGAVSTTVTLGGSATLGAGNDYTTTALTLNWADGDVTNRTITVTVNDDATPEGAETVTLTLGAPGGGATLGVPSAATLTIQASDQVPGTLAFAGLGANQVVNEAVGTVTYTFSRTGGSSGAVSVTVTLGGSAVNPADYTNGPTTLSWADGDTLDKTLIFTVVDDAAVEGSETITLTLGAPSGGAVLGAPGSGTLTILDNDGAVGQAQAVTVPAGSRWSLALLALLLCLVVARSLPVGRD